MKKYASGSRGAEDSDENALAVFQETVCENAPAHQKEKNPAAVALGRMGGRIGGMARAAKLSASERSEIARKAASARWRQRNDG